MRVEPSDFRFQPLAMGRTYRHRRKKHVESRPLPLGNDEKYLQLVRWLSNQQWLPTCKIAPVLFRDTGRGMVAKENISAQSILASLPSSVLITVQTVAKSVLSGIFLNPERCFSTQQILSAFLVWQKHLGKDSHWLPYLNILPDSYYSPVFCSDEVIDAFPNPISDKIYRMQSKIDELYDSLVEAIPDQLCDHCDKSYNQIFSFEEFKWAWFTVNSRSVYLSPLVNDSCKINLIDANSIALAPFLDMINHSDRAKVNVLFDETNCSYSIMTLVPYKKNEEVFINYGGHNNEKLYLEYGFVLPSNRNDSVSFTSDDIFKAVKSVFPTGELPKNRYNFLKSHGFLSDLYCSNGGLSWNTRALIYVLLEPLTVELGEIQKVIFSASFHLPNQEIMHSILTQLFSRKISLYNRCIESLKKLSQSECHCSITVNSGIELLQKYLVILEKNAAS